MTALLVAAIAVLGLLVGSFLNVVIARVPQGRSVVRPGSACACGRPIAPRDNVPVLSWLVLRGRARCCGRPIPARYPLVELGTATAFGAIAAWQGLSGELVALLYLAALSIALAVIDLDHKRLPDALTLPSYPVAAVLLGVPALVDGDPARLVRAAGCGIGLWLFYFVLRVINPGGMGYGDVKLGGVLGLYLGYYGIGQAVLGTFLGFVLGGVVGITLMMAGRAGRKSAIPFGPFMLVGAWAALVLGAPIVDWYLRGMGL